MMDLDFPPKTEIAVENVLKLNSYPLCLCVMEGLNKEVIFKLKPGEKCIIKLFFS